MSDQSPLYQSTINLSALPPFIVSSPPNFVWSDVVDGADFIHSVTAANAEVVHWKHILFLPPSGKIGHQFTQDFVRLFRAYGEGTALESIALKAAMIAPSLLLQKPHPTSKSKDHVECLQRRLEMWRLGDINGPILEGRVL